VNVYLPIFRVVEMTDITKEKNPMRIFRRYKKLRKVFRKYKEFRELMGKEDKIIMDVEEMKENLGIE